MVDLEIFAGRITSTGFSSGDRIVIGDWHDSPIGSFTNIMWAKPDGSRILLSPSEEHAKYVSELYNFESVEITDIAVDRTRRGISIEGGGLSVDISWGIALPIPIWRPLWFIATREWYSIRSISRVLNAEASFDGLELGGSESFTTNACFGFSEPPSMPASVSLKSYIE